MIIPFSFESSILVYDLVKEYFKNFRIPIVVNVSYSGGIQSWRSGMEGESVRSSPCGCVLLFLYLSSAADIVPLTQARIRAHDKT